MEKIRVQIFLVCAILALNVNAESLETSPRILQSYTSSCQDKNCSQCLTSSTHKCEVCRSSYVKVNISSNDSRCVSCYGCASSSCSLTSRISCSSCQSGFTRIYAAGDLGIYMCGANLSTPISPILGITLWILLVVGCPLGCFLIRWCCTKSMHEAYVFEKVVIGNQPPPYIPAPVMMTH